MANSLNTAVAGSFQALDVAIETAATVLRLLQQVERGFGDLADQARRAVSSTPLNLAEGSGRRGDDRAYHYSVALGSAREAATAIAVLTAAGALPAVAAAEAEAAIDRTLALCYRLVHPRR